jgi:hypothetical protein
MIKKEKNRTEHEEKEEKKLPDDVMQVLEDEWANNYEKELLMLYHRKIEKTLKNASPDDFVVCSTSNFGLDIAEELGIDIIEDTCSSCGCTVYRSNIDTRAKIICEDCFKKTLLEDEVN